MTGGRNSATPPRARRSRPSNQNSISVSNFYAEPQPLFVLHRATVGTRTRRRHSLAGERLVEGGLHIIGRTRDVGRIRRGLAVNGAFVNDLAFRIDDKHVGRVLGAISLAGL